MPPDACNSHATSMQQACRTGGTRPHHLLSHLSHISHFAHTSLILLSCHTRLSLVTRICHMSHTYSTSHTHISPVTHVSRFSHTSHTQAALLTHISHISHTHLTFHTHIPLTISHTTHATKHSNSTPLGHSPPTTPHPLLSA